MGVEIIFEQTSLPWNKCAVESQGVRIDYYGMLEVNFLKTENLFTLFTVPEQNILLWIRLNIQITTLVTFWLLTEEWIYCSFVFLSCFFWEAMPHWFTVMFMGLFGMLFQRALSTSQKTQRKDGVCYLGGFI